MVYTTSNGFRMIFLGIALFVFVIMLTVSRGLIFERANIVTLALCAICTLSSLFLERWIFDKELNLFERDVGLVMFYRKKTRSLDSLQRIVLDDLLGSVNVNRRGRGLVSRRTVVLYVQDLDDRVYKLNIVRGFGAGELRRTAEKLSEFCGIPFEDKLLDSDRHDSEAVDP